MGKVVQRKPLSWSEQLYLPAILSGLGRTWREMFQPETTLQYPEERPVIHDDYRGAPGLVRDDEGREKCVSCQLCEYICPPKAIMIKPAEIRDAASSEIAGPDSVEKAPKEFFIDMLRCIYCGYCEEVCPEEAIFMTSVYELNGSSRAQLVHDKPKLYEIGGTRVDKIKKWKDK